MDYNARGLQDLGITEKRNGWREHSSIKTEKTIRTHLNLFLETLGANSPAFKLDISDVSLFKDTLMNFPSNRTKMKKMALSNIKWVSLFDVAWYGEV